ncbi:MAG: cyclopropane-fatty-acyl-phospholipid synthase [Candidatus Kerfeldbacteria bacterium RIFCSPHIGHO2_12_FULL_48_17]|uniref:Cyclopropane-fatty-acyl-phospholipid synthase n=1 Tax=Candidatus Kerfeldbacteria bacterium RIFCSPHIGHO2_12_FULL_48_17 TaxID=1798542 RepID=A0A1G2B7X3_9BACT|nr:MAG: cyclopropane-fatty-acyl-phospholipid synthase [Candidatus Kerfeldbacteria bacterium RIFCSPHIGHO2_12_FULL_48_17]
MSDLKQRVQDLLALADVQINGSRPWDIQIKDDRFYQRVFAHGSLGLGESYMDGWWDVAELDVMIGKIMSAHLDTKVRTVDLVKDALKARLMNLQSPKRAFEIGEKHYDVGNDLYERMLGKRMAYTCGYWKNAETLEEAQEAKLDLLCRKIGLKKGDRVLDIGGGWGSFAGYAAEKYGASVVATTVSKEQVEWGRKRYAGMPIEFRLQDYRETNEQFDHVVSVGMVEHVGYKNYRTFMESAWRNLKQGGFFLLHTIGGNKSVHRTDPWIAKYIFPNSMLPSVAQLARAMEGLFVMEDWHNFGYHYYLTLREWFKNFDAGWPELQVKYGDRFYRMWKYYLLSCAGLFQARQIQLWQVVMSKGGVKGGYNSIR